MSTQFGFIKAAVDDTQLTIRALDVKAAAILVLLIAPFPALGRIFATFERIFNMQPRFLMIGLCCLFILCWALAIVALVRGLAPLDNPANHISSPGTAIGAYYGAGLYKFAFFDALLNRDVIQATKPLSTVISQFPSDEAGVISELVFEHMKLCYIREVKIKLLRNGIRIVEIWLGLGALVFLLARYG